MASPDRVAAISKILSANDTGDTGAHQAGILVPKDPAILGFFPELDRSQKNPRFLLVFHDDAGARWEFSFIYYNNAFFGGTRNEYRLTRMTPFFKSHNLQPGDELILLRNQEGRLSVTYKRSRVAGRSENGRLRLGSTWKIIQF